MKTKLLTLLSLLALLLVSTAILADGRPTGIRIGRVDGSGGSTTPTAQIDVTVTGVYDTFYGASTTIWLGNAWTDTADGSVFRKYASSDFSVPLPWAIDWGDGYYAGHATLFGPPGGPFRATFSHTYLTPGSYAIVVGKSACCDTDTVTVNTGNAITGNTVYRLMTFLGAVPTTYQYTYDFTFSQVYPVRQVLAITANTTIRTGFGIPTTNTYGLIALALLLVGSGLLLFRKPQQA